MITDAINHIVIFQFGVGGNGSWLVGPLCKFINSILERTGRENYSIQYYLIDDDVVETRNILRQNFEPHDVGRKKISAMIRKYCSYYDKIKGIDYRPDTKKKIERILFDDNLSFLCFPIIIGCTDNNKTRRAIFNSLNKLESEKLRNWEGVVYFDAGNNLNNGQITTCAWFDNTYYYSDDDWRIFKNERKFKNPPFLKLFPAKADREDDEVGCAFYGDQSLTINMFAATQMFANIQRLFIDSVIPPGVKQFNSTGYATFEI